MQPNARHDPQTSTHYDSPRHIINPVCPILTANEILRVQEDELNNSVIKALYSSFHGGIILDPKFMMIPFADHMVHRGHAVFDTATLIKGRVYKLDDHLMRFFQSADVARINLPFRSTADARDIILRTCAASGVRTAFVRYWLSAGGQSLSISPAGCTPTFWVAVLDDNGALEAQVPFVNEALVSSSTVPLKPVILAKAKTTNYLLNVLCAVEATRLGGRLGIWLDEDGCLAEASVASVIVLSSAGELLFPRTEKILSSVTMISVKEIVTNELREFGCIEIGEERICQVQTKNITKEDLIVAREILIISLDLLVESVQLLDGSPINSGKRKGFGDWIKEKLLQSAKNECNTICVPYGDFQVR